MIVNPQVWFALTQIATHSAMGFYEFEIYQGMTCIQGGITPPYRIRRWWY